MLQYLLAVIQVLPSIYKNIMRWWIFDRPAGKILDSIIKDEKQLNIFIKDLIVPNNTITNPKLISIEGNYHQNNPNIDKVWPDAEARGIAYLLNLLGSLGKKKNIEIVEMSSGYGMWDSNLIVLGAQAGKSREFYQVMEKVGYFVDDDNIYDFENKQHIERASDYGYGLIIKAKNPKTKDGKGIGILLGGFGILGTKASIYYFCNNIEKLGKEFGKKYFSIIVRARVVSGEQSAERLKELDKVYN